MLHGPSYSLNVNFYFIRIRSIVDCAQWAMLFHFRLMEEQLNILQAAAVAKGQSLYSVQARYKGGCADYNGLQTEMREEGWIRLVEMTQTFVKQIEATK